MWLSCFRSSSCYLSLWDLYAKYKTIKHKEEKQEEILRLQGKQRFLRLDTKSVHMCAQSCPTLCTLWTVARQAPLSMGFPRQEHWRGSPFPSPGDLLNPGTEPASLVSPALAGGFFSTAPPGKLIPKVLSIKGKTDKFDVLKMSNFCNTKDSAKMTKKISYGAEE